MVARISNRTENWFRRIFLSLAASPFIIFVYGVLAPTPANAEEVAAQVQEPPSATSESETTTNTGVPTSSSESATTVSGGETNSTETSTGSSTASEEVVLEAAPAESTQGSIAEAATAVATAASEIQTVSQELSEVQQQASSISPTPAVTEAVQNAVTQVEQAQQAVEAAQEAVATAEVKRQEATDATAASQAADAAVVVAQGEVAQAETAVGEATVAVEAQIPVVSEAQANKDSAQAIVDANTAQGLKVEVYSSGSQNASPVLSPTATPIRTYTDTNGISENWASGAVAGSTRGDDVIVIYKGQLTYVNTGTSWYTAQADDGTRVYLDGVLVANDWVDKGGGGSTITVQTTAGQTVPFELWYYENGGGAHVHFLRYTEQGWVVETNFSTSSATTEQLAALDAAQATLTTETNELTNLQTTQAAAETTLISAETNLQTAQTAAAAAETSEQLAVAEAVAAEAAAVEATAVAVEEVQEAQTAVAAAQVVVSAEVQEQSVINAPTNLQIEQLAGGYVKLTWDAPVGGATVERYAVSWQTDSAGWGVASYETTITLGPWMFEGTGGWRTYNFSIRSDNDSRGMYSTTVSSSFTVTDPTPPPTIPAGAVTLTEGQTAEIVAPQGKKIASITAWYGDPNDGTRGTDVSSALTSAYAGSTSATITSSNEFGDPAPGTVKTLIYVVTYEDLAPAPEPQNPNPNPQPENPPVEPEPENPQPEQPQPEEPNPTEPEQPSEPEPEPENPSEPTDPEPEPEQPSEPEQPVEPEPEPEQPSEPEPEEPSQPEEPAQPEPEPEPEPKPQPEPEPEPSVEPEKPSQEDSSSESVIEDALSDGKLTEAEKEAIVDAILEELKPGEAVTAEQLAEAGLSYEDLPPETPVETRTDEDGNPVIITAEVAAALTLLENPAELLSAVFSDPAQALTALANIGADMSPQEREEAEKMVVATVVAAGAAIQAAAAAAAGAAGAAGSSSGGNGGGGAPVGREGGTRRPKPTNRTRKVK